MRIFYEEWRTLEANSSVATDELRRFPDSRLHEYWLFTPFGYLGQLSHYLHVLDDEDRLEGENPPVGIILCKDADKTFVEYVLQDYQRPMGVATYKVSQEKLKEFLPDKEEMKKLM